MNIGILSDIHGDFLTLEKAIALFDAHSVDAVVCVGDLVDGAGQEQAVVALLQEHDIPCVLGNHDRDLFAEQAYLRKILRAANVDEDDRLLDYTTVGWVANLPLTREFTWEDHHILLAHGSPTSNITYVFPHHTELIADIAQTHEADVFIFGHTHLPMAIQYRDQWFFNAGSIYSGRGETHHTCGILTLPNKTFTVFDLDTKQPTPYETKKLD